MKLKRKLRMSGKMSTIVGNFLRKAKNVVVPIVQSAGNLLFPGLGTAAGKVVGGAIDKREAEIAISKSVAVPPPYVAPPLVNTLPPNLLEQSALMASKYQVMQAAAVATPLSGSGNVVAGGGGSGVMGYVLAGVAALAALFIVFNRKKRK